MPSPPPPAINIDPDDDLFCSLDRQKNDQSPPLDRFESHSPLLTSSSSSDAPTQRSYLFILLTSPDMGAFLENNDLPEDVYQLPLPLSTLLIEAKEEVGLVGSTEYSALRQLSALRDYVWAASGHDVSSMLPVLEGLIKNEDQLGNILGKHHA